LVSPEDDFWFPQAEVQQNNRRKFQQCIPLMFKIIEGTAVRFSRNMPV
jgi:hypothetical protein